MAEEEIRLFAGTPIEQSAFLNQHALFFNYEFCALIQNMLKNQKDI